MNRGKQYQAVIVMVVVLFVSGLIYCGVQIGKSNGSRTKAGNQQATGSPDFKRSFTGVVKGIDEENQTISLLGTDNAVQMNFRYNGGTDIKDQYGKVISMKVISLGEIVEFTYDSKTNKLLSLNIDKNAWTYENVKKMKMDAERGVIQLGNSRYGFTQNLLYVGDNEIINLSDLSSKDQLTIKGIGDTVYSIIVTKGHGMLRFTNIHDFIGGTVYVGASTYKTVKGEPFNLIIREGTYKIVMQNGELIGTKNVTVERDQEVTVDMSEFKISKARIGKVSFKINPYGADLYINGKATDYSKPITLNYGNHTLIVKLAGYKTFSGVLTVGQSEQEIEVNLVPKSSDEESTGGDDVSDSNDDVDKDDIVLDWDSDKTDDNPTSSKEPDASSKPLQSTEPESSPTPSKAPAAGSGIDTLHKITISSPENVEVYIDDAYKGISPVSFTKVLGTHTVTLKKEGYTTKTYTIHVEDNNENAFYTFSDLVKK